MKLMERLVTKAHSFTLRWHRVQPLRRIIFVRGLYFKTFYCNAYKNVKSSEEFQYLFPRGNSKN